jgi:hypothetical protein
MTEPEHPSIPPDMTWRILDGRFTLIGFHGAPTDADLRAALHGDVGQVVRDGDETTLLLPASRAVAVLERHPVARSESGLLWVRFDASMAWDVVGFLALVTTRLAQAGVPLGAVCGYSRDHLFIAEGYLGIVREVLGGLFPERLE